MMTIYELFSTGYLLTNFNCVNFTQINVNCVIFT